MTSQAALPIAPRPEDDELLSSWQARVAGRYGLTHDELSRRLGVLSQERRSGFIERDFAPSSGTVRTWATACRLSERQIGGMALSSRSRSSSWYVWGEGRGPGSFRRPVCLECLAEDAAVGRDHHFRQSWALVETLICGRHHCPLEGADDCLMIVNLNGWPGVGKLTTARELSKLINGRLLDNHTVLNVGKALARDGSPEFYALVRAVRSVAFDAILELPQTVPVIFTNVVARGGASGFLEENWRAIIDLAHRRKTDLYSVTLACSAIENARRIAGADRAMLGKRQGP